MNLTLSIGFSFDPVSAGPQVPCACQPRGDSSYHAVAHRSRAGCGYFLLRGVGRPRTFTLTRPNSHNPVTNTVVRSSPPKQKFVMCLSPARMVPRCWPDGSMIQIPPGPVHHTLPSLSTFIPSGAPGSFPLIWQNTRSEARFSSPVLL